MKRHSTFGNGLYRDLTTTIFNTIKLGEKFPWSLNGACIWRINNFVGTAIRLGDGQPRNRGWIPGKDIRPFLGPYSALYLLRTRSSLLGPEKPGCEVDHSHQSRTQVKNRQNSTSIPPYAFLACVRIVLPLLSNFMERGCPCEANTSSAIGGSPRTLCNPDVVDRVHYIPSPVPILSQMYLVYVLPSIFLKTRFNIILPSTSRSSKR